VPEAGSGGRFQQAEKHRDGGHLCLGNWNRPREPELELQQTSIATVSRLPHQTFDYDINASRQRR